MGWTESRARRSGAGSFSFRVKAELASLTITGACCTRSELAALIQVLGSLVIGGNRQRKLELVTEHPGVARRAFKLVRRAYGWTCSILTRRRSRLRKNRVYMVVIPYDVDVRHGLADMGFVDSGGVPWSGDIDYLVDRPCCQVAYLRGRFLGGGSVLSPERGYHLALDAGEQARCQSLLGLLQTLGLVAACGSHRRRPVVYVKEGESVARFLQLVGAHGALLEFEERRVVRDMRNRANRRVNAETANMDRTVRAGLRQARAITSLEQSGLLGQLEPGLALLARLRVRHPEASLRELGEMLDPPLSKAAVQGRLRRLERLSGDSSRKWRRGRSSIDTL